MNTLKHLLSEPGSIPAIVGAVTAIIGAFLLAIFQISYNAWRKKAAALSRAREAGHRAMLSLEAQKQFDRRFESEVDRTVHPQHWKVIRFNRESIPRVRIEELDFLITKAKNQNILPQTITAQQNFDQFVDTVHNFADIRREYEVASAQGQSSTTIYAREMDQLSQSINSLLEKLNTNYPGAQRALSQGLKEAVPGFTPIYKS